jgi:hypothetical protein
LAPLFPPNTLLAALCEASLTITFDLDIRGFLPVKDRCIVFALAKVVESLLAWFFTGQVCPIVEELSSWLLYLEVDADDPQRRPSTPCTRGRTPDSLRQRTSSRREQSEVTEENLEDDPVEEVLEVTEKAPNVFFVPKLLMAPEEDVLVDDTRVPIEDTPAVWPEFLEREIPVPIREALREIGGLTIELVRLVRVPALLCRLFFEAKVLPKEGIGDLEREPNDEVEVEVDVPSPILLGTAGFSRLPSSSLLREGILLPLAMAVVGWAGAIDDFFLGPRGGGPILGFDKVGSLKHSHSRL